MAPEQDGVRRFGTLQRGGRKGLAGAPVQFGAGFEEGEAEREATDAFGRPPRAARRTAA